jgi:hypothetical protein
MRSLLIALPALALAQASAPSGDAELAGVIGGKPVVVRTTSRLAGAIDSVKWDGFEFIDSHDHGRQLQSAVNADVDGVFHIECYNPTEAGSAPDGLGPRSTSQLEFLGVKDGVLSTRTRMAYWLAPGMKSHGQPAQNTGLLSDHVLEKQVRLGRPGMDHVIDYRVTFRVPADRPHRFLQFEVLTGYMPWTFGEEWRFDAATAALLPLPRQDGEQRDPVVLSTASGAQAMGVFAPPRTTAGRSPIGYGRFKFERDRVVKWNCVVRERGPDPLPPGDRNFQLFVVLGTREDCRRALVALDREFPAR